MYKAVKQPDYEKEQPYAYWLAGIERIGNAAKRLLSDYAGGPRAVYQMKEKEYDGLVPEHKKRKILAAKDRNDIAEEYERLVKRKIQLVPFTHPSYPERLGRIADAPYALYLEGTLPREDIPAVAVIGARQYSEYGRIMAQRCGRELAAEGINVVSGMARGIDGICQESVLEAGGKTYAVLGCGTNVCYPYENRNIYIGIKQTGGIISEYPPDTQPKPQLFPPRNRIISGLSDVVLIVEAREKSGTLITADMALEQGKEVYVIPGRVTDLLSEGCIRLSKQGAGIMTSVREMLEETGLADSGRSGRMDKGMEGNEKGGGNENCRNGIIEGQTMPEGQAERLVFQALDYYPKSTEVLQRETKLPYREIICILVNLCGEGMAEQITVGHYVKKI